MAGSTSFWAGNFLPCHRVPIGFEAIHTGDMMPAPIDGSDPHLSRSVDAQGRVIERYSLWGCFHTKGNRASLFVVGIALTLLSDTFISFNEFLGHRRFNSLVLPTYYLARISITVSVLVANGNSS
jgi:hypothetical protein